VSDPDDILGKTDALLGRYRGGVKPATEGDFPVLTEVIGEADLAAGALAADDVIARRIQGAGVEGVSDDRILQEVLRALAPRIDEILGDPLKERLEDHVRNMLQTLTDQMRMDVEALVRIAVSRAVEQVLSEKNNPKI
jgi:hypothetical protein